MNYRSLVRLTQPTVEPVSLAEAKLQMRIDTTAEDALILSLIGAAREWCEAYARRTFVHTQWKMTLDGFPVDIRLPRPPVATATGFTAVEISYVMSETMQSVVLPSSQYRVDRAATPGILRTLYGQTWPPHLIDFNSVAATWWAGYGEDGTKVPKVVRPAMLMLIAHLWQNREMTTAEALNEVPMGTKKLLDTIKFYEY
jgi:uncharacterized phiE125 gp8 family phage protein